MSYYAPFYTPSNYYAHNAQNAFMGQNNANYNTSQQNDNTMLWVLGKNEAESYPVAPNCSVVLWDKNAPTIYVKSMTANGIPNIRTLDFKERIENEQKAPNKQEIDLDSKFATKDEIIALKGDFDDLKAMYDRFTKEHSEKAEEKPKTTPKKVKESE